MRALCPDQDRGPFVQGIIVVAHQTMVFEDRGPRPHIQGGKAVADDLAIADQQAAQIAAAHQHGVVFIIGDDCAVGDKHGVAVAHPKG